MPVSLSSPAQRVLTYFKIRSVVQGMVHKGELGGVVEDKNQVWAVNGGHGAVLLGGEAAGAVLEVDLAVALPCII